jgi:hypothetical protein
MRSRRGGARRGSLVAVLGALLVAGFSGRAAADDACDPDRPAVEASIDDDVAIDKPRLLRLLRIELEARGLSLCTAADRRPIALIHLVAHEGDVTLTVEVRDRITAKEVKRDVPVGSYPADARPLLVAVAMDELLRASWAELALVDAPPPAMPPPPAVREAVRDSIAPPPSATTNPRVRIGASAAIEHFADGATLVGGDVTGAFWIVPRLAIALRLALRGGVVADSANGTVAPSMLAGGLGAAFTLTPPAAKLGLDAFAHVSVARIAFGASAANGARAIPQSETTVLFDLGLEGWLALGRWVRLVADVSFVQPLRPVRALDGATTVVGVGGPAIGGGLGACATF